MDEVQPTQMLIKEANQLENNLNLLYSVQSILVYKEDGCTSIALALPGLLKSTRDQLHKIFFLI